MKRQWYFPCLSLDWLNLLRNDKSLCPRATAGERGTTNSRGRSRYYLDLLNSPTMHKKRCRDYSRAPLTQGGGCGRWQCEKTVGLFSLEKTKAASKSSLILHTVRVTNKKDEPRGNSNKWKLSCYQKKALCNECAWAACQGHFVQLYRCTLKVPVLAKCHFL